RAHPDRPIPGFRPGLFGPDVHPFLRAASSLPTHGAQNSVTWFNCAQESRLKPRLGSAAEAASRGQFTDRAEPRVHSRLFGGGRPSLPPSREFNPDAWGAELRDLVQLRPRVAAEAAARPCR